MSDSPVITASGGTLIAERARHKPASKIVNPLRIGLQTERNPQACAMVIFGVSGDLTSRKLMPALYDLYVSVPLPPGFSIVGISRRDWSDDDFRCDASDRQIRRGVGGRPHGALHVRRLRATGHLVRPAAMDRERRGGV